MTKPTAAANAIGLPKIPAAPYGHTSCSVDMRALLDMSMAELKYLRSALRTLGEVAGAISCQPRFEAEGENRYNNAGRTLDGIYEFLAAYEQAVVNVAEVADPIAPAEVEHRAWTLLGFEADLTDDLASFAVRAAEAVRDETTATFRERCAAAR